MTDAEAWEFQKPLWPSVFTSEDAKGGPSLRREAAARLDRRARAITSGLGRPCGRVRT